MPFCTWRVILSLTVTGFRWFSWYTGVAVLWMIYITGINCYGYGMLRTIAVASAEGWITTSYVVSRVLPEQGSVNDRFFSLLFAHLGIFDRLAII